MPLTKQVKFLQKAAIVHQGKALIVKRDANAQSRPGAWDLPGGNAEWPITDQPVADIHQQEIAREITEETGLQVEPNIFTDENLVHFTTYFEADLPRYAFICGWRVAAESVKDFDPQQITLSAEHTDFVWVGLAELDNYDFAEPVGTFIKTIIQNSLGE